MSGLQALPSWKCAVVRPIALALQAAAQQLAQSWYRGRGVAAVTPASRARRRGSMAGVCAVAILLLAVPLFTFEADARGGGFGGHGGGFGGHGGFGGRGGMGLGARGGGVGGGRSFRVARFGGAGGWGSLLRRSALRRVAYWRPRLRRPQFRRTFIGVAAGRDRAVRGHRRPLYHRLGAHARRAWNTRCQLGRPRRVRQSRHRQRGLA